MTPTAACMWSRECLGRLTLAPYLDPSRPPALGRPAMDPAVYSNYYCRFTAGHYPSFYTLDAANIHQSAGSWLVYATSGLLDSAPTARSTRANGCVHVDDAYTLCVRTREKMSRW